MFQSKAYIERRHGKNGTDRAYYLRQLVQEYTTTENKEAKQQVLANLANFAYDPINYNTLWDLQVIDLFLDALKDTDPLLQEFGMGGIANICLANVYTTEQRHYEYLLSQPSYRQDIIQCLTPAHTTNTQLNAMTALMLLVTGENYQIILTKDLEEHLLKLRDNDKQIQTSTMATLFLNDFYYYSF